MTTIDSNLSLEIDGLQRSGHYELPIRSIREMIVNAVTHRNYMIDSCILVAEFDDRIEVTSPGMLFGSLDIAAIKSGRSETRNRTSARVFDKMRLIESWGTGIRRIIEECEDAGLPEPKFSEIGDAFRVEVFRKAVEVAAHASDRASDRVSDRASNRASDRASGHADTRKITDEKLLELVEFCSTPKSREECRLSLVLYIGNIFAKQY
jgi:predicted HTH transcriptional regulator